MVSGKWSVVRGVKGWIKLFIIRWGKCWKLVVKRMEKDKFLCLFGGYWDLGKGGGDIV